MERTVEALVVVDHSMMEYHKDEDIETYVLTIMNLVAKFYRDPSIGNLVNIALVRLILLEDEQDDFEISSNADDTLNNFCKWQENLNSEGDEQPNHHDNAILLTRKDLCRGTDSCVTLGLAHVSGMCSRKRSCSINEDNGLAVGFTVAHEMGHNFGMQHDSSIKPCSSHDDSGPYVMSSRVPSGLTPTTWSACSREYITRFLDSGRGRCLEDTPTSTRYQYPKVLPGVMYSADHQCRLQYGHNATASPMFESDLCTTLWCSVGAMRKSRMTAAAQGTRCGKDKWCISGECLDIDEHSVVIDGGWGPWSEYSECSLTCGRGIKSKERHCNNPSPSHGGRYCVGERKKYTTCNVQDCAPGSVSVRAMQCSAYDTNQLTNGTQRTWIPADVEGKPCELFCRRRDRAFIEKKSDHVTDGTPCTRFSRDICIDGICQMVGCDNVVSSGAVEDRCGVCHGDGSSCRTVEGSFNTKYGRGYVEVTTIPAGARNVVVEELASAQNYLAVSNATGHDLLNMDWNIEWSGEYQAAGTIISYERIDNKERMEIQGPTSESLFIYLIFQRAQNPGIIYEYTIPRDGNQTVAMPQFFSWVYTDWSPCSASCGIGYQRSNAICKELIAGLVDDRYCDGMKPDDKQRTCNAQQCPASWWEGPWQHCAGSCGEEGRRQRSVFCIRGSTNGEQTVLDDMDCLSQGQEKPVTETTCDVELLCESDDNWQIGEWSQCSASCGDGWHTRSVVCMNLNKPCSAAGKPSDRRPCLLDQCPVSLDFSNDLAQVPGSNSFADDSSVDLSSVSMSASIDYAVNFGEWEEKKKKIANQKYEESAANNSSLLSSLPIGEKSPKLHHELNITTHDVSVTDQEDKDSRLDHLPVIPGSQYVNFILFPSALNDKHPLPSADTADSHSQHQTPQPTAMWSKQPWQPCSASCGDGIQQRIVECIDRITGQRTSGCLEDNQPISIQSCNLGSCPQACRNTLSTTMCQIIVQSGSCSQTHFRERCCLMCAEVR